MRREENGAWLVAQVVDLVVPPWMNGHRCGSSALATRREALVTFFADPEHEEPVFVSTLSDHSLAEVRCDEETSRDKAFCNCGMWASEWEPSIGQAREAWARHVWEVLNA